jgi:hypothetical protein
MSPELSQSRCELLAHSNRWLSTPALHRGSRVKVVVYRETVEKGHVEQVVAEPGIHDLIMGIRP